MGVVYEAGRHRNKIEFRVTEKNMKSRPITGILRVSGWMAFFLLLSAPVFFVASANTINTFVIRNARVFDGHKILNQADVWVEGGKIKAISKNLKAPSDVKAIEASGDMLLPGLIDSHTQPRGSRAQRSGNLRRHDRTGHV
jgi:hypothetical protein